MKSFSIDDNSGKVTEVAPEPVVAPVVAVEAERLPAEEWATRKGMFPQMLAPAHRSSFDVAPTPDGHGLFVNMSRDGAIGPRTNANFWKFAAAKAHNAWPIGLTMTEADFDKAVIAATDGVTNR